MTRKEAHETNRANPPQDQAGPALCLRRGLLVSDKLWQPGTDVAAFNRLMKDPAFRGLYETRHFVPQSLRRKKMLPLLPTGKDDPRIDQFADWFLSTFQEFSGCVDGSDHPAVKDFLRSYPGGPNAYLRGQTFALTSDS